jgi:short-subunit dehydrogenase
MTRQQTWGNHVETGGAPLLVTGASGGIGREIVLRLACQGSKLALTGRSRERLDALAQEASEVGASVIVLPANLEEPGVPERLVSEVVRWGGGVRGVISCAGGGRFTFFSRLSKEEFDAAIRLNLLAPIDLVRAALPYLIEHPRSWAIFVNTIAAREPAPPRGSAYLAAKAGLIHFAEAFFAEIRDRGVTVSSILPDLTDTALVPESLGYDRYTLIRPSSVADAVLFAMTSSPDVCITELHLRPQPSLRKASS